jgi:hypothetical protein
MEAAMTDDARDVIGALDSVKAMQAAWRQVNHEELAAILREIPQKLRNQMFSAARVPSSKITNVTARLLVTNLSRKRTADEFRVARTITGPIARRASDVLDEALVAGADVLDEMKAFVNEHSGTPGASIVVLGAVAYAYAEPERFATLFVGCQRAGVLTDALAGAADQIGPMIPRLVEELLETELEPAGRVEDREGAGGDSSLAGREVASDELDILETKWHSARVASGRVYARVRGGAVPDERDREMVETYSAALVASAEAHGAEATMKGVTTAIEAEQHGPLDGLAGPEYLAGAIEDVKEAQRFTYEDSDLNGRLSAFHEILTTSDALEKVELAGLLRGSEKPPASELLDAALAGLLSLEPTGVENQAETGRAEAALAGPSEVLEEIPLPSDAAVLPPSGSKRPAPTETVASEDEAAVDVGDIKTSEAGSEAVASEPEDAPDLESEMPTEEAQGAEPAVAKALPESEPALEKAALTADEFDRPAVSEAQLSDEDVSAILCKLVADHRFGLAHHLAFAAGQDYHAEILKECALAHGVRTPGSPAAAAMVAAVAETLVNPADDGSVVLRCAALLRVALLDPGSGAPQQLRQLIGDLDQWRALQEFSSEAAQAAEQMVPVSASGEDLDAAGASDEAAAIASWAQDTLTRPPRQNRLYRGVEIWKQWSAADGPLGRALGAVAADDPSKIAEIRELCGPFATRKAIEHEIDQADKRLRAGRGGKAQRIIGPAKEQLIRLVEELVGQAMAWCDASSRATGKESRTGIQALAQHAGRLRTQICSDLDSLSGDAWLSAAACGAKRSIECSLGLLFNTPLTGQELDPSAALNRGLALVKDLPLATDLEPMVTPTLSQLVVAATSSRAEAFTARLAARDFIPAEVLVDLEVGPADGLDTEEARRRLRATEREARGDLQRSYEVLERRFAAARARGRIDEDAAARLYGELLQAQPAREDAADRRDLGQVDVELRAIGVGLSEAISERSARVHDEINAAVSDGDVSQAWAERLRKRLEDKETGAAEEYLFRALAGEEPPAADTSETDRHIEIEAAIDAWPAGIEPAMVEAVLMGVALGPLDFTEVDELVRPAVGEGLSAWITLANGPRPDLIGPALEPVLRLVGLLPTEYERSSALRAASTSSRWFIDVQGAKSGYAFIPEYGSRSKDRRRFLICWDNLPASQLWDAALTGAAPDQPVYVLLMHMLSREGRVALAREARNRESGRVVVIDDAVIACCAQAGHQAWDVTMRAVVPYAAPNPYDPDVQNTPEEMFYGRRAERDKVASMSGTSFISGGRRFGKSALLRSAVEQLEGSEVLPLLIQIQHVASAPPNDPKELWGRLAVRLEEAGVIGAETPDTSDAVASGIRGWLEGNPGRSLLLLLDECDFFLKADATSHFRNVAELRDLMSGSDGRFKVVFSGLQHVARYRKLPNQPLSHLSQPLVIGPLDPSSASGLVRRPLRAMGWSITDAHVDRLVTYCACNPSVIQLACKQLVDRLHKTPVNGLAPWTVEDSTLNELLSSAELAMGVRTRLFYTLDLDHRYKLLAYLVAWRAINVGLGEAASVAELRNRAAEYWPEGFAGQDNDDVRSLCDELVGLGVFAGDAAIGYRMLSPATVQLFGTEDEVIDALMGASENYVPDIAAGAGESRISIGNDRFSPLTADQLSDAVGVGRTQLRVVVGSRALLAESVPDALATATRRLHDCDILETSSLRQWRDAMSVPRSGHLVVVADMTGVSRESCEQSIESAQRRGAARTAKGTRSAVLVAGPSERWLLSRLVATGVGDLVGSEVGLRRISAAALRAWDRIEELDLAHPKRQAHLLEVTGGWPQLVGQVIRSMGNQPFEEAIAELETHLATPEGARELVAAVGLDVEDPTQPADPGVVAVFWHMAREEGWRGDLPTLAELLALEGVTDEDPSEVLDILRLIGALALDEEGEAEVEPVLASCAKLTRLEPVVPEG